VPAGAASVTVTGDVEAPPPLFVTASVYVIGVLPPATTELGDADLDTVKAALVRTWKHSDEEVSEDGWYGEPGVVVGGFEGAEPWPCQHQPHPQPHDQ